MKSFRILSSGTPVGTVVATDPDDALLVFTTGRGLPLEVELRAYSVTSLESRRPRAARGYRV